MILSFFKHVSTFIFLFVSITYMYVLLEMVWMNPSYLFSFSTSSYGTLVFFIIPTLTYFIIVFSLTMEVVHHPHSYYNHHDYNPPSLIRVRPRTLHPHVVLPSYHSIDSVEESTTKVVNTTHPVRSSAVPSRLSPIPE